MIKPVYTTFDISRFLSVDITTVMKWVDEGKIPAYKTPGGHRRVTHANFIDFLERFNMPVPPALAKQGRNVLVVEDDVATLRLFDRFLKKTDPEIVVEKARDGFEAGQKLESFHPDLVILDINLPGVDGFRVCKTIRSTEKTRRTRILAVSGHSTPDRRSKILQCGADEFLAKPFSLDVFSEKIKELIGTAV